MAKQIVVAFRSGMPNGDAGFLAKTSKRVFDAVGSHPIAVLAGSPVRGCKATIDDGDVSVDCANAIAQGVKDSGGPLSGYTGVEIDSLGVQTTLVVTQPS